MAWSIFQQGGGSGSAITWAKDLLAGIGAPDSPGNEQFVYDWELSEGSGGAYNPLNQGPVPGAPQLTTTGAQYGGGAADFAGWGAGLTGAVDYLNMPNFSKIKSDLVANNPTQARSDLVASPWAASHYGNGANFATAPEPGKASALPANATLTSFNVPGWIQALIPGLGVGAAAAGAVAGSAGSGVAGDLKKAGAYIVAIGSGAALIVAGVYRIANPGKTVTEAVTNKAKDSGQQAATAAALAA